MAIKRIAIIPARGGSKRIPGKNIMPFCGKPMIAYALEAAKESKIFDLIHVSTDSPEIARVVEQLGFSVDFFRKDSLADDFTGLIPVISWVLGEYKKIGAHYDQVCCIMPNAPLLKSKDLVQAFKIFEDNSYSHPLLVYTAYPVPTEWVFRLNESGLMMPDNPKKILIRSQDLGAGYYECGPFNIWGAKHLNDVNILSKGSLAYFMPRARAIDIDTLDDLEYAQKLYQLLED